VGRVFKSTRNAESSSHGLILPQKKRWEVWKNLSVYDKFSNRMSSHRRSATAIILTTLVCLVAMATLSCNVAAVPGRFTYVVKYEVTANAAVTVNIDYTDGTPAVPTVTNIPGQTVDPLAPWSIELPSAFSYDAGSFYPILTVTAAVPLTPPNDIVTVKIIWKDYRLDFQDQVLILDTLYDNGSVVIDTVTLTGPELPRP